LIQMAGRAHLREGENAQALAPFHDSIPQLTKMLGDPEHWVCDNAALVLGAIGPEAKAAVPPMIDPLKNNKRPPELKATIARAVCKIGPGSSRVVEALIRSAQSDDRMLQCAAVVSLGGGGRPDESATVRALLQTEGRPKQDSIVYLRKMW